MLLINAFKEFPRDDLDRWIIPAVPDGDYYFFIQKEFKWGILSHPWEKTITVWYSISFNGTNLSYSYSHHFKQFCH